MQYCHQCKHDSYPESSMAGQPGTRSAASCEFCPGAVRGKQHLLLLFVLHHRVSPVGLAPCNGNPASLIIHSSHVHSNASQRRCVPITASGCTAVGRGILGPGRRVGCLHGWWPGGQVAGWVPARLVRGGTAGVGVAAGAASVPGVLRWRAAVVLGATQGGCALSSGLPCKAWV
jgi:hypothetical protein